MRKIFVILAATLLLGSAPAVFAAEFVNNNNSGQINVPSSETHKNLYAAGGNVSINGTTVGDLTVAGGSVVVNGQVQGELLAAGGNIFVGSPVIGTARIAGGNISLNAPIGGDLMVAGGSVNVSETAAVSGDIIAGGGMLTLNGPVAGTVHAGGGTIIINGKVNGNVYVTATKQLTFGPNAVVGGTVFYRGMRPASVDPSAKVGTIAFTQISRRGENSLGKIIAFGFLIQFLGLIVAGFLLLWLRRRLFAEVYTLARSRPWVYLGLGTLGSIALPITIIVLFITVIGYYAALIALFVFILILLVITVFSSLAIGNFALSLFNRRVDRHPDWQIVLTGAILWEVLKLIPVLGWLIMLLAYFIIFGASLQVLKKRIHEGIKE